MSAYRNAMVCNLYIYSHKCDHIPVCNLDHINQINVTMHIHFRFYRTLLSPNRIPFTVALALIIAFPTASTELLIHVSCITNF